MNFPSTTGPYLSTMTPTTTDQTAAIDKDAIIASLIKQTSMLQTTVNNLEEKIKQGEAFDTTFEASKYTRTYVADHGEIPQFGMPAKHVVRCRCI